MQGFKSFPDKTVLNFGKGITAVVGPNGSGKSNISDAVRWVLGETSTKSLRGSKMEDVIFGGTSARKALGFAQVQLTLDNSDGTLKDRGEIVTVTRRYYRSGESEYYINRESVRLKDINNLLMDTGLGRDGYSIIGQGRIGEIVSSRSTDSAVNDARRDRGTLIASGLIAGGALFGVFAALTNYMGFEYTNPLSMTTSQALGCVMYLLLIIYLIVDCMRAKKL